MTNRESKLLMAAVAGISMGLSAPLVNAEEKKADDGKCWGINGCGSHAKCAVSEAELKAVRTLLGDQEFQSRFGKSEVHSCGSHAKCGASSQILNWVPATRDKCKAEGGYLVEEVGPEKKKVAKKA